MTDQLNVDTPAAGTPADTATPNHHVIIKLWGKGYSIQVTSQATDEDVDDALKRAHRAVAGVERG